MARMGLEPWKTKSETQLFYLIGKIAAEQLHLDTEMGQGVLGIEQRAGLGSFLPPV